MKEYPQKLFYMVDIVCNERCSKCHHWNHSSQRAIPNMDRLYTFINSLSMVEELVIVGGEPLIYSKDILGIIENLKNKAVRVTIITNGVLANQLFINSIAGKNVHIVFSIDTLDPKKWLFVRGRNSRDIVLKNFEYARSRLKPEQLSVQSVLSIETEEDVKTVGKWLKDQGIYHSIQMYVSTGFEGEWHEIDSSGTFPIETSNCIAHQQNMSIFPNGDVYTCFQQSAIPGCQNPIGNINETDSGDILKSPYLEQVRKVMRRCQLPCKVLKCNKKETAHEV